MTVPGTAVLLAYDGVAGDEAGALVEILTTGGVPVVIASVEANPVTSFHGRVVPQRTAAELADCQALLIPGGMGVQSASGNQPLLRSIRQLAKEATWLGTTSTGSVMLAAAGLADGATITTHWLAGDLLPQRAVTLSHEPYVEHGRLLTAAGLASTATLAFRLVGALAGVENEERARAHYQPRPTNDRRYQQPTSWWRSLGKRQVTPEAHPIDPERAAEIVLLDLSATIHSPTDFTN